MTDNEIIKALERCFTRGFDESTCYECPFYTATAKCAEYLRTYTPDSTSTGTIADYMTQAPLLII